MAEDPSSRGKLSFSEGFTFGLGFWTAGLIFNLIIGLLVLGVVFVLPALGCGLLSTLGNP